MKSRKKTLLLPILFSFFVMGFVDVVGISTSYIKADFGLNDKLSNLIPMMVFLWFAIFSLPTGALMNRIGRKNTVLLSACITGLAMLLPVVSYSFPMVLLAFAMLGIGNTILQVSLNPLLMNVVDPSRITSMLTLGQFIKAISSTMGPILAAVAVGVFGNWQLIFPLYAVITLISWVWLFATPLHEESRSQVSDTTRIWTLFTDKYLLMLLSVIVLIVGFEIGLMTAVPKYLIEKCGMPLEKAGLGCSLYYIARTVATFAGSIILAYFCPKRFLIGSMAAAVVAFLAFMLTTNQVVVLTALFCIGILCANVFAIIFAAALAANPTRANQISALMIMGVAGGALIPPIMGVIADFSNQQTSLIVLIAALVYIFFVSFKLRKK